MRIGSLVLRAGAVVVSVILLSFTVSAQGLMKQILSYNSFGKTAILMVSASGEAAPEAEPVRAELDLQVRAGNGGFLAERAFDLPLEIEAWMTDEVFFGAYRSILQEESDIPLEIETWMTSESYFCSRFTPEREDELKLETWMIDKRFWNN